MYTSQRTQKTEHCRDSAQLASLLVVFVGGHSWQLPDHVIKSTCGVLSVTGFCAHVYMYFVRVHLLCEQTLPG